MKIEELRARAMTADQRALEFAKADLLAGAVMLELEASVLYVGVAICERLDLLLERKHLDVAGGE
jgi:hypothetical protein